MEQENPNYLYHLTDDQPLKVLKTAHAYNSEISNLSIKIPPGHPEGIFDSMGNIYHGVAKAINNDKFLKKNFLELKTESEEWILLKKQFIQVNLEIFGLI